MKLKLLFTFVLLKAVFNINAKPIIHESINSDASIGKMTQMIYSPTSKTYAAITTINKGENLKISTNQTIEGLAINGGILEVDLNVTLTITGEYSATGGTINNLGTIKFSGGSVTFPGLATINNGVSNTMAGFEVASTGIVTLNSLLNITNYITVSSGTLLLLDNNLRLNNAIMNIANGATFDNGGENQINQQGGTSIISISGTFITRAIKGFVGTGSAIPSITPILNSGCTIEYGLNGNQTVQGGMNYFNLTFSNSGIKTLSSAITNSNAIIGTVTIKDAAILDVENKSFGGSDTNLTMVGTSEFRTGGTDAKPDARGTYLLGTGTKISFTNNSNTLQTIRLFRKYYNIDIVGSSVGTSTLTGGIDFQSGGKFIVKSSGTFKNSNTAGFSGGAETAISNVNNPTIILETGSTIEYAGTNQTITNLPFYSNLAISGTGIKMTTATTINIGNDLIIKSSQLKINNGQTFVVVNKVNNSGGLFIIENNGSLVQINDVTNTGHISYNRQVSIINRTDYTYWSSPVLNQNLQNFSPNAPSDKFYSFDSAIVPEDWKQENPSSTVMGIGKGYCIYGIQPIMLPSSFTFSFIGIPNNGSIQTPVVFNGAINGTSNLIGNPYPSALDADKFLTLNSNLIEGTLYFWTHNTPLINGKYTANDYASYNKTGGVNTSAASINAGNNTIPNGKISAGQGFFTTCIASGNLKFNNNMRLDSNANVMDNSQFYKTKNAILKKDKVQDKHRIWLNLTNSQGIFKQLLIGYITDATNQYDNHFDGVSFNGNEYADFYSIIKDKNLVIQGRSLPFDQNDQVSLGFRTTIEGDFSINIDQRDGVFTNQEIYLEDKLLNTIHNLTTPYTFTTVAGTFDGRFVLRYTNKTLKNNTLEKAANQILVSNKDNQIKVISTVEKIDKIAVYDFLGRLLFKKDNVNENELSISSWTIIPQNLLLNTTLQNGYQVTNKLFIRK